MVCTESDSHLMEDVSTPPLQQNHLLPKRRVCLIFALFHFKVLPIAQTLLSLSTMAQGHFIPRELIQTGSFTLPLSIIVSLIGHDRGPAYPKEQSVPLLSLLWKSDKKKFVRM